MATLKSTILNAIHIDKASLPFQTNKKNYQLLEQNFMKIQYPIHPVSLVQPFQQKIESFNNKQVEKTLCQLNDRFNSYRKVRGDGNCFFRALGFTYLSSMQSFQVQDCFPLLNSISLTECKNQSIKPELLEFYDEKFLKNMLTKHWKQEYKPLVKKFNGNYNRALCNLLTDHHYFDFIIILYFRSICLKGLNQYKYILRQFLNGNESEQIKTYSRQSEGIIIDICARFLKISIAIYEVRTKKVIPYQYCHQDDPKTKIVLLYTNQHYDILESKNEIDISLERLDKKQSIIYYSEVNQHTQNGVCIQCGRTTQVYVENSLCDNCFQMNLTGMISFKKDKKKADINNSFKCINCSRACTQKGLCQYCMQNNKKKIGRCPQCNYSEYLDAQIGLCDYCIREQKKQQNSLNQFKKNRVFKSSENLLLREQNKPSSDTYSKNICNKCNQFTNNGNPCKNCKIQNGFENSSSLNKLQRCKNCKNIKSTSNFIDGICTSCKQKASMIPQCNYCHRKMAQCLIKQGRCFQCRKSRVIF